MEPRILLSGEGFFDATPLDDSAPPQPETEGLFDSSSQAEELLIPLEESLRDFSSQEDDLYDPANRIDGLFAGFDAEELTPAETQDDLLVDEDEAVSDRLDPSLDQLNDSRLGADQEAVLTQGLQQLARVVALLEAADEMLAAPLFFVEGASVGTLDGLSETIDTRLTVPVFSYFNDGMDPPSLSGVNFKTEQNSDESCNLSFSLDSLKGTYSAVEEGIYFNLQVDLTRSGYLCLDAESLDQAGISFSAEPALTYTSTIEIDYSFGGLLADTEADADQFFITSLQLDGSLHIVADDLDGSVALDELPGAVDFVDGAIRFAANLNARISEEVSSDKLTLLEWLAENSPEDINEFVNLTLSGGLTVELPLELFAEMNYGAAEPSVVVQIDDSRLFNGSSSQGTLVAFSSALKNSLLNVLRDLIELNFASPEILSAASFGQSDPLVVDEFDSEGAASVQLNVESKSSSAESAAVIEQVDSDQEQLALEEGRQQNDSDNTAAETNSVAAFNHESPEVEGADSLEVLQELLTLLQSAENEETFMSQWALLLGLPLLPNLNRLRAKENLEESNLDQGGVVADVSVASSSQNGDGGPEGASYNESLISSEETGGVAADSEDENMSDRFGFDSRDEQVFDGLDPPAGTETITNDHINVDTLPAGNYLTVNSSTLPDDGVAVVSDIESSLTDSQLNSLLEQALQNWAALPLTPESLERLNAITAEIADLPGGILGEACGYSIIVDLNAAGYGWFVDGTPADNSEFELTDGSLQALEATDAFGRIDLLTVIEHEIGHVLGYGHDSQLPIMNAMLLPGERVLIADNGITSTPLNSEPATSGDLVAGVAPVEFGGITFNPGSETERSNLENVLSTSTGTTSVTFHADIELDGFVHLSGTFTITRAGTETVDIATGLPANAVELISEHGLTISDETVSTWTLTGTNVQAFVGLNGPYLTDTDGNGVIEGAELTNVNADSTGLSIVNLNVAAVLMIPVSLPTQPLYALIATATSASLVGMDGVVAATARNIRVEVNSGNTWPGGFGPPVVDFASSFTDGYVVGGFDFAEYDGSQRIGATADSVVLELADFVHVIGSFSFEMGPTLKVDVATGFPANLGDLASQLTTALGPIPTTDPGDGTLWIEANLSKIYNLEVDSMQIGSSNAHVFVGLNGPYLSDSDGNGVIDGAELTAYNTDAVGLSVSNVDFGFVTMAPTLAALPGMEDILPKFTAIKATADSASLVGMDDVLSATLRDIVIEVNDGTAWPGELGPPVVDFAASFATDEVLSFFDDDGSNAITVGDLRALGVTTVTGLYDATTVGTTVVSSRELIDALDANNDGQLQLAEVAAFGAGAGGITAAVADADGDGKLDPPGYEIRTGTTTAPVYIDYDGNQRIGASADSVALQLSEFVYVIGSFSFQKGPTHKVDMATGLPSSLGSLASQLTTALDPLPTTDPGDDTLWIESDLSMIYNLEVDSLQIGSSNAYAFVGMDGPYLSDTDGNGVIDGAELTAYNADAVGVSVSNVDFGFVTMAPTLASFPGMDGILPKFTAIKATADSAALVGMDALTATLSDIVINVNNGTAWPLDMGPPVIDFAASFATDEILTFFDSDGSNVITVGDLRALGVTEVSGLYNATTNEATVVSSQELIEALDANSDGQLKLAEVAAFGAGAGDITASVADADGDGKLDPPGYEIRTGTTTAPVYIDYDGNQRIGASVSNATLRVSEFVHITGSFALEMGPVTTVDVTGGLLTDLGSAAGDYLTGLGLPGDLADSFPATGGATTEVSFMTIGASDVHAFVGMDGPYWTDTNGDGQVTRTAGVPDDGNGVIDADESLELDANAKGLWLEDFDFGLAIMTPTNPLDFAKYFALKASAEQISLVGIEGVTVNANKILVEVNQSTPAVYGVPLFPVVDFANTAEFASEELVLFHSGDGSRMTEAEFAALIPGVATPQVVAVDASDHERLLAILDTNGDGMLQVSEAAAGLGGDAAAWQSATAADRDGDGKIDPLGYEVATGTEAKPVYLGMDSHLIRAQGFVELNLFDSITITGSVAFELGPTKVVTLTDGTTTKNVSTMSIGAANVSAFIGSDGPYWTDLDGDHAVSWTDINGNPLTQAEAGSADTVVDANETFELNGNAIGFHVTDLDLGVLLMAEVDLANPSAYLAAKLSVNSFGLVGVSGLTVAGAFDVELNVGLGLSSFDVDLDPVDFVESFSETRALFALLDDNNDGTIDEAEQNTAFVSGSLGGDITSIAQLVSVLNTPSTGTADAYLYLSEVRAKLKDSFETAKQAAMDALDADRNTRINTGFEVNTGNPAAPVSLDFDKFLISIRLGGQIQYESYFRLNGLFLFEVDGSGLKAFVAAGLEVGPDIGASSSDKTFIMDALGALVITGDGVAADIDVSISVGGSLSSVLKLNMSARMVFNFTGQNQTITIPANYVGYLTGATNLATLPSETYNPTGLSELTGALDSRFTVNADGSASYTIDSRAPRLDGTFDAAGDYFLISLHGDLTIVSTFEITGDFQLMVSGQALELGFNGSMDLGGFVTLDLAGGAVIESGVFAAYAKLAVDFDVLGVNISGQSEFKINSGSSSKSVFDALGQEHVISAQTYMFSIAAKIDLFGVLEANGSVNIGIVNGNFMVAVDATMSFFKITDIHLTGYFNTNGTFRFTGSLNLDLTAGGFGIKGGLSVSLTNSGFSGSGSVSLVILGQDINIASATVSVNWSTGAWLIRAEGPLSVWLEVTSSSSFPYFSLDGGLGAFDAIIGALGDAAEAVGEAVTAAATAVYDAVADMGAAIVDFGEDVVEFFEDVGDAIVDVASAAWDAVSGWFSDERTIITKSPTPDPTDYYVYSTSLVNGTLTINNGTSYGSASQLNLWVVDGNLVIDAPDTTRSVVVSTSQDQERDYTWDGWPPYGEWGDWYNVGSPETQYATITIPNATNFAIGSVSQIIINGTNSSETIVLDRNTVSINTHVHGNGGNDVIVTGKGDDRVWGGDGNDIIFTYEGDDFLYGENQNDKLFGGLGTDALYGGSGNDLLDENQGRVSPLAPPNPTETNILDGSSGDDIILGSPGSDTITGGSGNDTLVGLAGDDTYLFFNSYGTDKIVDYHGKETLDFSDVTSNLSLNMSDTGFTANAGAGHLLTTDQFTSIKEVNIGSGNDHFDLTRLPNNHLDITDDGGVDVYDFDLDATDAAQSIASVDIVDTPAVADTPDTIDLDVASAGFDLYLHPQAVLLNNFELTFNTGIEKLNLTDHATSSKVTTKPGSGFESLLIKTGVTVAAKEGPVELIGRSGITMQDGSKVVGGVGTVTLTASAGNITMHDGSLLSVEGIGGVTMTAPGNIALSTVQATSGNFNMTAGGALIDNTASEAPNLTTSGLVNLDAATGIGAEGAADIDSSIGSLTAVNRTSGAIYIQEVNGLTVAAGGVRTLADNGLINLDVDAGNLVINGVVTTHGSGTINLNADAGVIDVNADVSSTTGVIELTGDGIDQDADIFTTGIGYISLFADNGPIRMGEGATSSTTMFSPIFYQATGDILLSLLRSSYGVLNVESTNGAITDNTAAESPNLESSSLAILTAVNGVGGTGDADIETSIAQLRVVNSASGGIYIQEQDGLMIDGPGVTTLGGNGSIDIGVDNGLLHVNGPVTAHGSGSISLSADSGLVEINNSLVTASGNVNVNATAIGQNADISTDGAGSVHLTASGGGITMADVTTTTTADGDIVYRATGIIGLSRLVSSTGMIDVQSTDEFISDNTADEDPNLFTSGLATLYGAAGIGGISDADIDTSINTLTAEAPDSGDIFIQEVDTLVIDTLGVSTGGSTGIIDIDVIAGSLIVNGPVTSALGLVYLSADAGSVELNAPVSPEVTVLPAPLPAPVLPDPVLPAPLPAPELPASELPAPLPEPELPAPLPEPELPAPLPEPELPAPLPEPELPAPLPEPELPAPLPEPVLPAPLPEPELPAPLPEPELPAPLPEPELPAPLPEPELPAPLPEPELPAPLPEPVLPAPLPEPVLPAPLPEPVLPAPLPEPVLPAPLPEPVLPAPLAA